MLPRLCIAFGLWLLGCMQTMPCVHTCRMRKQTASSVHALLLRVLLTVTACTSALHASPLPTADPD